jgi:hypothetical protein
VEEIWNDLPGAGAIVGSFTPLKEHEGRVRADRPGPAVSAPGVPAPEDPIGAEGAEHPFVMASQQLCDHHRRQWEAEDRARQASADAEALAAIKRTIDTMNMRRSGLIDDIDTWVADRLPQNRSAPLHTETLGGIIDRLCIAWVRAQKLRLKNGGSHNEEASQKASLATRQLAELSQAYDTLLHEIAGGLRQVPDWRLLKSYG